MKIQNWAWNKFFQIITHRIKKPICNQWTISSELPRRRSWSEVLEVEEDLVTLRSGFPDRGDNRKFISRGDNCNKRRIKKSYEN